MNINTFLTAFGPHIPQREHQENRGRRLYATDKPYHRCATDAERDGYVAGQAEYMQARADQARLHAKLAV
jgi:hypothetical protein